MLCSSPPRRGRCAGSRGATSLRCAIRVRLPTASTPSPPTLRVAVRAGSRDALHARLSGRCANATTTRKPKMRSLLRVVTTRKPRARVAAHRTCGARSLPSCFDLKKTSRTSVSEVTGSRRNCSLLLRTKSHFHLGLASNDDASRKTNKKVGKYAELVFVTLRVRRLSVRSRQGVRAPTRSHFFSPRKKSRSQAPSLRSGRKQTTHRVVRTFLSLVVGDFV